MPPPKKKTRNTPESPHTFQRTLRVLEPSGYNLFSGGGKEVGNMLYCWDATILFRLESAFMKYIPGNIQIDGNRFLNFECQGERDGSYEVVVELI